MNKRSISLSIGGFLFFFMTACALFGAGSVSDTDINVGIDRPKSGDNLPMGPVRVVFSASSNAGVAEVELSINDAVVMEVMNEEGQSISISEFIWTPETTGAYLIRVRARSDDGAWSGYEEVSVTVEQGIAPTSTSPVFPTATPGFSPTAPASSPTTISFEIFDVDTNIFTFYYGDDDCGPQEITITAKVNFPGQVKGLVLFTRFADHESFDMTSWDSGRSMSKVSDDTYRVTLDADDIPNYNEYEFATLFYQIVATGTNGRELGRTTIFKDAHLEICPQPDTPAGVRFKDYTHDVDTFYYGAGSCGEDDVTITTDVTRHTQVEYVILFTRFKDKDSDDFTDWDSGSTMKVVDDNTHRITLRAFEMDNYNDYDHAQMSYQFVAVDENKKITGRSLVFDDISLENCLGK